MVFAIVDGTSSGETSEAGSTGKIKSIEEQIRAQYGMVKLAGVWLPVYPLAKDAGAASSGGLDSSSQSARDYAVPLYITTGSLPAGTAGEPYSAQIDVVGGVPPYVWSIQSGAPGPAISLGRDSGMLAGTPPATATSRFRVQVTDAAGAADIAEFTLRIAAAGDPAADPAVAAAQAEAAMTDEKENAAALAIATPSLPPLTYARPYSFQIQAAGGRPPYAWSMAGGTGPQGGLVIDAGSGVISGTLNPTDGVTGEALAPFVLSVIVTDSQGMMAQKNFSLQIIRGLTITQWPTEPVEAGEPWSFTLRADGGQSPYLWSSGSQLPPGLALSNDGILSGTPSQAGEFMLEVRVTDQDQQIAAQSFALTVKPSEAARVTRLTAFISLRRVSLTWSNPVDMNFSLIRMVRNAAQPPASASDGQVVFEGSGVFAVDSGLTPGTYHYAAFALNEDGIAAEPARLVVTLKADADPFADAVIDKQLLHAQAYNQMLLPGIVLGSPKGGGLTSGSLDVASFGAASVDDPGSAPYGGSMVLSFENNLVVDGPGADFTVFENVFYYLNAQSMADPEKRMMEPAIVSVSQDGVTWHSFPFDFSPRYDPKTGALNLTHPFVYNRGFAGVNPVISNGVNVDPTDPAVSGGDSFDLADLNLPDGLDWIRYVRLQSTGHKWLIDMNGDTVHHPNDKATRSADRSFNKSGFDLDAVTAIWMERIE